MLRSCSESEFQMYSDFIYELAEDPAKSGYPTYCDGIKTKAEFVERSLKAFERDTEKALLFEYDGAVQGMIHYFWIPEDHYLQTVCFNVSKAVKQAIAEFLEYVSARFKGYDVYLRFPAENDPAVSFLSARGSECIEDDYNNTAFLDKIAEIPDSSDLVRIEKGNYGLFESLHQAADGYWNSERIFDDLDSWIILVKETAGDPQGAVYYRAVTAVDGWFEIYGIDLAQKAHDPGLFKELLNAALMDAKRRSGRFMTFFCDEEYEKAAIECGFQCIGKNFCYKVHLE